MDLTRRQFLGAVPVTAWALPRSFRAALPDDARADNERRFVMHWYIFGPAWTETEAVRQLRNMHQAHVGGVLIFPTYPIAVDDPARGIHNQQYLDRDFFRVLNAVVVEAARLGMSVDMVLGTGWPYGGPTVSIEDSAHALRVREGDPGTLAPDERVVFDDRQGSSRRVFYSAPTQMRVKRAARGGEGLVVDHYRSDALARYLEAVGSKLLSGVPKGTIRGIFCDSLEVYRANWTDRMPNAFRERRGYDLLPRLPALFDTNHPDARHVRCDFWRTCSELAVDEFIKPLHAWCQARGVELQVEAYGTPPVSLAAYQHVDMPVGEHYEWKEFSSSRWASSGAHLAGRRVVLAEGWTWAGLPDRFSDSLERLKLCSDLHFLCGINALYGLTYAYSPMELGSPGWPPYFGPVANDTQPFWRYFHHLVDYIDRTCRILQQGRAVADVAVYLPVEDCMAESGPEQLLLNWATRDRLSSNGPPPEFSLDNALHYESDVVTAILAAGHAFDGIDTFTLNEGTRIENGRLRRGDGSYAIVVLPNLIAIDAASLERLATFVHDGGVVIATRRVPRTMYGVRDREANEARVRSLVVKLFGSLDVDEAYRERPYGRGRAIVVADEQGSLRKALAVIEPDVTMNEPSPTIGFVHRETASADHYFLANTSEETITRRMRFRAKRPHVVRRELTTDRVLDVPTGQDRRDYHVTLGPYASCVITFSDTPVPATRSLVVSADGKYTVAVGGATRQVDVNGLPAPRDLTGGWTLLFPETAIGPIALEGLSSWTEIPRARFVSGVGRYETEVPLERIDRRTRIFLDLGRVCETAEVWVNEQPAGVAWMRPHRLDITELVRPGSNRIRVDVTNLLINKVLGDGPIDYSDVVKAFGDRFPPGDEWSRIREPRVSGMLGPVTLVYGRDLFEEG